MDNNESLLLSDYLRQTTVRLEDMEKGALRTRKKILNRYRKRGDDERATIGRFLKSLSPVFINRCQETAGFGDVFRAYERNFPIEEERESLAGFKTAAGFNFDRGLQNRLGPFEEGWLYFREPKSNAVIGGINFTKFSLQKEPEAGQYADGTQHIMYLFVAPEYRRLGVGKSLVALAENHSRQFVANTARVSVPPESVRLVSFNEQNQPLKMTLYQYLFDTANAGVDQYDRLIWWQNLGYRPLRFRYVSPPLESGGEPCDLFDLNVKGHEFAAVPGSLVKAHLYRFFRVKVVKDGTVDRDPSWLQQAAFLDKAEVVETDGAVDLLTRHDDVWNLASFLAHQRAGWPQEMLGKLLNGAPGALRPGRSPGASGSASPELRHELL